MGGLDPLQGCLQLKGAPILLEPLPKRKPKKVAVRTKLPESFRKFTRSTTSQ